MSRPLVLAAASVFIVLGLLPIAVMLPRIEGEHIAQLVDARTLSLLWRTTLLGLGAAAVAALLGAPYGYLVARTDVPGASWLRPLGLVPILLPPLFATIAWTGITELRGASATTLILGATTFPLVALFTARAASRIDGRLGEAAALVGGRGAVLRMELPLLLPGIAVGMCLAFVFAINDFSVPDYVSAVGPKFNVYADEVFATWRIDASSGLAVARSLPLVALTLVTLLPALALRRRGALVTLVGAFRPPVRMALGRMRWVAFAFCLLALTVGALMTIGYLVYMAGGGTSKAEGFQVATLPGAFRMALDLSHNELAQSLRVAAIAATVAVPLALVLGHALERTRRGRWLEVLLVLPLAVPAILFGIGYIDLWNREFLDLYRLYQSEFVVVLLLLGRSLAFPALLCSIAVASLDPRAEEAARLAGVRPAARLGRIVAPPLAATLTGAWVLVFVLSLRELDAAILVPAANGTAMFKAYNQIHFGADDFVGALCLMIVFFLLLPGLLWGFFRRSRPEATV